MLPPRLIRDFPTGEIPRKLKAVGNSLFFTLYSEATGEELWQLDDSGIRMVGDAINPGIGSSSPSNLTAVGSTLFFTAKDADFDYELWAHEEARKRPYRVANLSPSGSSRPTGLTAVNNKLFLFAENDLGRQLWSSEGASNNTKQITDFQPGFGRYSTVTAIGSHLYYTWNDGTNGEELWKAELSQPDAASLVADINPGYGSSSPANLTAIGQTLFFTAKAAAFDIELWKSDSTGTKRVKDIYPGFAPSRPSSLTRVGNTLFFSALNNTSGIELWKSDGTERGTMLVADIVPGLGSSSPNHLVAVGNTLYFTAQRFDMRTIWKSDGTAAGTVEIASAGASAEDLALVGETLYYLSPYIGFDGRGTRLMALDLGERQQNRPPVLRLSANPEVRLPSTIRQERIDLQNLLPYYFNLSVSDPDGDAITKYRFELSSDGPIASYLRRKDGSLPARLTTQGRALIYEFSTKELASIDYIFLGANLESTRQAIKFQVADARGAWSKPQTVAITISAQPRVQLQGDSPQGAGRVFADNQARTAIPFRDQVIRLPDVENDPIIAYNIKDGNQSPESGFFRFKGKKVESNDGSFVVFESDLDDLFWVAGQAGSQDAITLRATDAIGDRSEPQSAVYRTEPAPTGYLFTSRSGYNRITEGSSFILDIQRQNNFNRASNLQWWVSGVDTRKAITADSSDFSNAPTSFSSITFQPGKNTVLSLPLNSISDSRPEGGAKGIETARIWFFNREQDNGDRNWLNNPAYSFLDFNIFEQPVYILGQPQTLAEGETATMSIARFGGGNKATSVTLKAQSLVEYHGPRGFTNTTGIARNGDDFVSKDFNVKFTSDGVKTFSVPTIKDNISEGPEVFVWSLENPTRGSLLLDDHSVRMTNILDAVGKRNLQSILTGLLIAGVGALAVGAVKFFQSFNDTSDKPKDTRNSAAFKAALANSSIEYIAAPGSALTGIRKVYDKNNNQTGLLAGQSRGFARSGLVGNDSASLVGNDSASLVGNDSASIKARSNGNLVGNDSASLVGNDSASLVGNDSASLVGNDSASLISNGGRGLLYVQSASNFIAEPGGAYFSSDLGMVISEQAQGALTQLRDRAGNLLITDYV